MEDLQRQNKEVQARAKEACQQKWNYVERMRGKYVYWKNLEQVWE